MVSTCCSNSDESLRLLEPFLQGRVPLPGTSLKDRDHCRITTKTKSKAMVNNRICDSISGADAGNAVHSLRPQKKAAP